MSRETADNLVNVDPLTNLLNRRGLEAILSQLIEEQPEQFSISFIDINDLKIVNDSKGHVAGDELLINAANIISGSVRSQNLPGTTDNREFPTSLDFVSAARYGGDEFVIIHIGVADKEELQIIQNRIQDNLMQEKISAAIHGKPHEPGESLQELIDSADKLMMAKKSNMKLNAYDTLPIHKKFAAKLGKRLLEFAGVQPPR